MREKVASAAVVGILDVCLTWRIPMNAKLVSNVVRCLSSVVFLVTCITSTLTATASHQKTDGTIVDAIEY